MRSPKRPATPRSGSRVRGPLRVLAGLSVVLAVSCLGLVAMGKVADQQRKEPRSPSVSLHARFDKRVDASEFQKGNLHTHSNVSDGDVAPREVYEWYRDHGYNFVALTDHNTRVDPKSYEHLERTDFRILAGEEITMSGAGRQVHVNALCIAETIGGGGFDTVRHALDHAVSAVGAQGGIALINHPNFDFGLTSDDVNETRGASLIEVWSGHPYVWTLGKEGRPSHERLWEVSIEHGLDLAPAGVDDAHDFLPRVSGKKAARPGRAWVQVFADRPDPNVICDRLRSGDLYASNGAELDRLTVGGESLQVWPASKGAKVEFIGEDGVVLSSVTPGPMGARYELRGGETFVRARVTDADGKLAFTPAYRVIQSASR